MALGSKKNWNEAPYKMVKMCDDIMHSFRHDTGTGWYNNIALCMLTRDKNQASKYTLLLLLVFSTFGFAFWIIIIIINNVLI